MATKMPSIRRSSTAPVLTLRNRAWVTSSGFSAPKHLFERGVPYDFDLGMLEQPILQDLLGAEGVAAVHQGDLGGEVGEIERFLDRGVAAAYDDDLLAAVEEAVAGRTGRYAITLELLLRGEPEPRACAPVAMISVSAVKISPESAGQAERAPREVDFRHGRRQAWCRHSRPAPASAPSARVPGSVGKAGIVLDIGGDGELAARLHALIRTGSSMARAA